jgi:hypothetical protein
MGKEGSRCKVAVEVWRIPQNKHQQFTNMWSIYLRGYQWLDTGDIKKLYNTGDGIQKYWDTGEKFQVLCLGEGLS